MEGKLPSFQRGGLVAKKRHLTLLQESDVPHGLGRGLPHEGQGSLPGLVRVGDRVSLCEAGHQFGTRKDEQERAGRLMTRCSPGLKQEPHEVAAAPHGHCSRERPLEATHSVWGHLVLGAAVTLQARSSRPAPTKRTTQ